MGVVDIAHAFTGGGSGGRRVWSAIAGIVSVIFGLALFLYPAEGALALLWLIGLYLIVLGVMRIIVGVFAPAGQVADRQRLRG